jgi:hypothetical protein
MNLHVLDDEDNESGLNAPEELKVRLLKFSLSLLTGVISYLYGL